MARRPLGGDPAAAGPTSGPLRVRHRVKAALRLVEAAAGDAELDEATPSAIAAAIRQAQAALAGLDEGTRPPVARSLSEALDAVEDGLPPDVTGAFLQRALRALR